MTLKRWLQKVLATMVLRMGSFVAGWVNEDVFIEAVQEEAQKHLQSQNPSLSVSGGLEYEHLKRVEDEWIARGIIQ